MAQYPPLSLDSRMPFGKYKGMVVRQMMKEDPAYTKWLLENTSVKVCPGEAKQEDELQAFLQAHPNPFRLNPWELKVAVLSRLSQVKKFANPSTNDWDTFPGYESTPIIYGVG